jgi:hypothetical protein
MDEMRGTAIHATRCQAADNAVEKGGSERWMVRSKKNNQTKIGSPDKAKGRFLLRDTALSPIF